MTSPFTLQSVMPASKPPRPGWVVPVVAALAALVLALAGVTVWALLRASTVATTTTAATTEPVRSPATTSAVLPLGGPAAAACHQVDQASPSNLVAMQNIGALAMTVQDNTDIRLTGGLLHDRAVLAIAADGQPDAPLLTAKTAQAAKDLRAACVASHYLEF